ncbi:MAG TPA: ABC transporter permease [Longimicrobium sp.]
MPFELIVAIRYLREGRVQTWLILTGIGVGVGVIVFLSALIGGLQASLVERTLGTQAHVVVRAPDEEPRALGLAAGDGIAEVRIERPAQRVRSIAQWQQAAAAIGRLPGVVAVSPTTAGPAMASRGGGSSAVAVRGIDPESYTRIVDLRRWLVEGELDLGSGRVVVGTELAAELALRPGDGLRLRAGENRAGVFTVSGIFDLRNKDLNARWVFVSLRAAQTMFALEGGVSTLEVSGAEVFEAENLAREIAGRTALQADSWMTTNAQLLVALRSQSLSSYLIQGFVILAVALGIASVLAISVVQKSREIGILRATGTTIASTMRIFLAQGLLLGLGGSAVGVALGTVLALGFSRVAQNPDATPAFPVLLGAGLYLRAVATATLVGIVAAVVPARKAARLDPATAIRNG